MICAMNVARRIRYFVITIIIPTQHSDNCLFPLIVHPKNSKRLISSFEETLLGFDFTKGINIQCNANLSLVYILPDINVNAIYSLRRR